MPTSLVVAMETFIMTTYIVTSDEKAGIMTTHDNYILQNNFATSLHTHP